MNRRACTTTWICATLHDPIDDDRHAIHQYVLKAHRRQRRLLVGGPVGHRYRVEDGDVGVGTDLEASLVPEYWRQLLESLRRHQRQFPNGVHETDLFRLAYVITQRTPARSRRAWMPLSLL